MISIAEEHPHLVEEAHNWDPATLSAGSNKKMEWKCRLGHVWAAAPNTRRRGDGCPICSGRQILSGFNDLSTTHPEIALQAYGWDARRVSRGSARRLDWICSLGHVWQSPVCNRCGRGDRCPFCANKKLLSGFNDLLTIAPLVAIEAHNWDPSLVIAGSSKRMPWMCNEGHTWMRRVCDRVSGGGCPSCAKNGFKPGEPGWLYLIYHPKKDLVKVGISNNPDSRLREHRNNGWQFLDLVGPLHGGHVKNLESGILRELSILGVGTSSRCNQEKFDGHTESWKYRDFPVTEINELLTLLNSEGIVLVVDL